MLEAFGVTQVRDAHGLDSESRSGNGGKGQAFNPWSHAFHQPKRPGRVHIPLAGVLDAQESSPAQPTYPILFLTDPAQTSPRLAGPPSQVPTHTLAAQSLSCAATLA